MTLERPRLYIKIQHTVRRDDDPVFKQLCSSLAPYPFTVVTDREVGAGNRTWPTYRRCLEKPPYPATHVLVLQDDVGICRNFVQAAQKIAAAQPDRLVALFLGNKPSTSVINLFQACDRGQRYAELDNRTWQPTQALMWPRFLIQPMLRFADKYYREGRPDDELIGQYCASHGIVGIATIPVLCQHEHAQGNSSLGAGGGQYRRAVCHIGEFDPLQIDWS